MDAVEIIRREACGGLAGSKLLERFPQSRRNFERRFREATGHSILDEILHVRLERVCTLLAQTDMAIVARRRYLKARPTRTTWRIPRRG